MNVNVCIFLYIKSNDDESSNIPNRIYHIELDVRLCCLYESAHTEYLPLYKSSIWKTILFFSFLFCSMKQAMNDVDDNDGGNNSTKVEKKKIVFEVWSTKDWVLARALIYAYSSPFYTNTYNGTAIIRTLETQLRYAQSAHNTTQQHARETEWAN